ncbi:MAG: hypothetical protein QXF25_02295 [Candidatus Pacearchaeota archaeon]
MDRKGVQEILKKYEAKLGAEIKSEEAVGGSQYSSEYLKFKESLMPQLSKYEKWCLSFGNMLAIKLAKKDEDKIKKELEVAHVNVTPGQVVGLAFMSALVLFIAGIFLFGVYYLISGNVSFMILFMFIVGAGFSFYYFYSMPKRLANKWRLKTSSQMVPCILYVVAYMKHTSNLERAVSFASTHLQPPLALDLKKVFWDVETGKYSTIKESLDAYLDGWRETNLEFVESFHLIESSLYEPSEERRIQVLERALQVILDGVYEKMLKFTREVRSPLTTLYMMGIVLPTLGIALLPLASTLLEGALRASHVFVIFNLLIPFFVYYMTSEVLMKRPGGHGETELLEMNPDYKKFISTAPYKKAALIVLPLILIGFLPFILQLDFLSSIGLKKDYTFGQLGFGFSEGLKDLKLFDFKDTAAGVKGPFGLGAILLSMFIPLGIALFFAVSYDLKTRDLIKSREDTRMLEDEFIASLFQLGNRLGDGIPAEIAFAHVAEATKGTRTENFFRVVNSNIQQLGMSLEDAIFNPRRGAIVFYPSELISTSMKILIESVKKGLKIAAVSLISISEYVKNIHKINERLRDLLAEVVSDMKSNMTFLAPLLAGIVVGLASMITFILNKLQVMFAVGGAVEGGTAGLGNIKEILELFNIETMIPTYWLQISIGLYIVEIIFILSRTLVTVDAGSDDLRSVYEIGKNLKKGVYLYLVVALVATLALSLLGTIALGGMT